MNIEFVFKIGAVGVLITLVSQILTRIGREDIATLVTLAGLVAVSMMVVSMISEFFESIRVLFDFD